MADNPKKYVFTLPVGTILTGGQNSYHIEEVLGQGGYGITYKVWAIIKNGQIPVKVPFAIKEYFMNGRCHRAADGITVEYSQEAAEDVEESLRDFVKEGQLLHRICQTDDEAVKYIVPVNEVIEANNTAYFVMQYLEGGSLRRIVLAGQGGLSEENALALIKPIARAVDFIHSHKVLHMDIKPENIVMHRNLLTGQEEPVLIDFGLSLHFNKKGSLTRKHTSFGKTEGFSPIEQDGAVEAFTPWIDVYALGATLYYLLTGKKPPKAFDMTPDDVDRNLPSNVSQRTKAAIKHAMVRDYHNRTQSASTFLWELENGYVGIWHSIEGADTNLTVKKKNDKQSKGDLLSIWTKGATVSIAKYGKKIGLVGLCILSVYALYVFSLRLSNKISEENLREEREKFNLVTKEDSLTYALGLYNSTGVNEYLESSLGVDTTLVEEIAMGLRHGILSMEDSCTFYYDNADRQKAYKVGLQVGMQIRNNMIPNINKELFGKETNKTISNILFFQGFVDGLNKKETVLTAEQVSYIMNNIMEDVHKQKDDTSIQKPKTLSEAEILEKAYKENNWKTIEGLANKGYVKSYYPLALNYYKKGNIIDCKKWAKKAIQAKVEISKASKLINEIEADEAYKKAELYFSKEYKAYDKALYYARKSSNLSKNHNKRLGEIIRICEEFNPPPYSE